VIICPKCGKENQDHYKFCLGCGNELPREAKAAMRPTPPAVTPPAAPRPPAAAPFAPVPAAAPMAQAPFAPPVVAPPAPAAPAAPPMVAPAPQGPAMTTSPAGGGYPTVCPQCASPNPRANRFCITCGFDMSTAAAAAPAAVATSAPAHAHVASPLGAPPPMGGPVPTPMASPVAPPMAAPAPVAPPAPAPVAPPAAPAAPTATERARLILVRPDGSEGPTHPLHDGENRIGRESGGVFASDSYLSPHHATFTLSSGMISVRDEGALNGVYVRVERQVPIEIQHGDVFRIGQEILRYETLPAVTAQPDGTERIGAATDGLVGRVSLVTGRDSVGNAFPVPISGIYLGRERGDILFPEDGYVSGLHCQLVVTGHRVSLLDVGSSNGTYVRMRGPRTLNNGDFLLLGQQLFRLQVH